MIAKIFLILFLFVSGYSDFYKSYKKTFPAAKINFIDVSEAPKIKIYLTFLNENLSPVPLKEINSITVKRKGADKKKVTVVKFIGGEVKEKGMVGKLKLFNKTKTPVDFILIAAGYENPDFTFTELGTIHKKTISKILKQMPKTSRFNVIWYNDLLYTYINTEGKKGELSPYNRYEHKCRNFRLDRYKNSGGGKKKKGKEPVTCELHPLNPKIGKTIEKRQIFEGMFPDLFNIKRALILNDISSLARKHKLLSSKLSIHDYNLKDEIEKKILELPSAIKLAIEDLLFDFNPASLKYILILSDGKDGIVNLNAYKNRVRDKCKKSGIKGKKKLDDCVEKKVISTLTAVQKEFLMKFFKWFSIMKANGIKVYSIAYNTGEDFEKERLFYLSLKTGGTYREIETASELDQEAVKLLKEIGEQYVIEFVDPGLKSGEEVKYMVHLSAEDMESQNTRWYPVVIPEIEKGLKHFVKTKVEWLKEKVGSPWYIIILVAIGIILLLLLLLVLKLGIKLVKKLFKKGKGVAKKGMKQIGR